MKLVIFGLSVSSSWGNGHAVLWRALIRSLAAQGHQVTFFERDVPYYAENRDLTELDGASLVLYRDWGEIASCARRQLADADAAIVTSYCPDALAASELVFDMAGPCASFTISTARSHWRGSAPANRSTYIGADGLAGFDLVLSYAGGHGADGIAPAPGRRAGGATLRLGRSGLLSSGAATGGAAGRAVLSRDLCRRSAIATAPAFSRARETPARAAVRYRRRALSSRFPVAPEYFLRASRFSAAASAFLRGGAFDPEHYASGDGRLWLVPVRAAV